MSDNSPDRTGSQPYRKRRKVNRKQKAPPSSQTGLCTDVSGVNGTINTHDTTTISKEVSQDYVAAVMSHTTPIMNFSNANNPFTETAASQSQIEPTSTTPPAWAAGIIEDIKSIKLSMTKIDKIEKTVDKINTRMGEMESKVQTLNQKVTACETSCQFISNETENQRDELKTAKNEIKQLKKTCETMTENVKQQQQQKEALNDKLVDLESRSMRENLLFYGLKEDTDEDCEAIVKSFIAEKLEIPTDDIILDRTHRLGSSRAQKPRPIVTKFHRYTDRENVRKQANSDDYKARLTADSQGVGIQWPQQLRDARKALFPIAKEIGKQGNRFRITGNKLYVNDVLKMKYVDGKVCDVIN